MLLGEYIYVRTYLEFMPFLIMELHCTRLPFALLIRLWVKVHVAWNRIRSQYSTQDALDTDDDTVRSRHLVTNDTN